MGCFSYFCCINLLICLGKLWHTKQKFYQFFLLIIFVFFYFFLELFLCFAQGHIWLIVKGGGRFEILIYYYSFLSFILLEVHKKWFSLIFFWIFENFFLHMYIWNDKYLCLNIKASSAQKKNHKIANLKILSRIT